MTELYNDFTLLDKNPGCDGTLATLGGDGDGASRALGRLLRPTTNGVRPPAGAFSWVTVAPAIHPSGNATDGGQLSAGSNAPSPLSSHGGTTLRMAAAPDVALLGPESDTDDDTAHAPSPPLAYPTTATQPKPAPSASASTTLAHTCGESAAGVLGVSGGKAPVCAQHRR